VNASGISVKSTVMIAVGAVAVAILVADADLLLCRLLSDWATLWCAGFWVVTATAAVLVSTALVAGEGVEATAAFLLSTALIAGEGGEATAAFLFSTALVAGEGVEATAAFLFSTALVAGGEVEATAACTGSSLGRSLTTRPVSGIFGFLLPLTTFDHAASPVESASDILRERDTHLVLHGCLARTSEAYDCAMLWSRFDDFGVEVVAVGASELVDVVPYVSVVYVSFD
jgi:hypothetical protein